VNWAIANRDLVAFRVKQCLYPSRGAPEDAQSNSPDPHELGKVLDVTHNSVSKHSFVIGEETKMLWVHRKGAAPSDKGVAPCPGSRGDFSWLLEPVGDGQYNGELYVLTRN
jgi:release factor H-coupled RctB family protein